MRHRRCGLKGIAFLYDSFLKFAGKSFGIPKEEIDKFSLGKLKADKVLYRATSLDVSSQTSLVDFTQTESGAPLTCCKYITIISAEQILKRKLTRSAVKSFVAMP